MLGLSFKFGRSRREWLAIASLGVVFLPSTGQSLAQQSQEVQVGSVDYQQSVNGIVVNVSTRTYVLVETIENRHQLKGRIVGDFIDLQRKIGTIIDSFDLPHDSCRRYSTINPVVSIPRKELRFSDNAALLSIGGDVTMWQCLENPVPSLEWEIRDIGFGIRTKVAVLNSRPGKRPLVTQPFEADLSMVFYKLDDQAIGLQFSKPSIEFKGEFSILAKGILMSAGVDIRQKAYDAVRNVVDPAKLSMAIPNELSKYNPNVVDARFFDAGGHLSVEIKLALQISSDVAVDLMKDLLNRTKN